MVMRFHGEKLSAQRSGASQKLAGRVRAGLKNLGFLKSDFSIALEALTVPSAQGNETAEFLFSPNPGEPLRALRAIASSGEISRVMFALKSALAAQDDIPVLVFDEIDANIGGEIASKVGAKMRGWADRARCFVSPISPRSPLPHPASLWSPRNLRTSALARRWLRQPADLATRKSQGCLVENRSPRWRTRAHC